MAGGYVLNTLGLCLNILGHNDASRPKAVFARSQKQKRLASRKQPPNFRSVTR
jgi:hypothetical protein